MRTVLVCVRTAMAAQTVLSCAARLGVSAGVRTALSETEAMARLAERSVDVVLADTAVSRPDTIGFTRRVLARAPRALVVLFGSEDPRVAAGAVAAGARGVIRGGEHELVSVVARALLLLCPPQRATAVPITPLPAAAGSTAGTRGLTPPVLPGGPMKLDDAEPGPSVTGRLSSPVVPAQRGDAVGATARRVALTERELQVLHGMADGKSNAEIGRELYVSEDTVKTHARRLFRKLGARDRAHAVAAGFRAGLVS
ncbi:helix-turn-helix transcriptional regulator [Rhizomonospora bruguierae]|uniref:helix-turn-helix transcriptional regulator n=1 Tax=Rhizomonospora bruguierae TaxID=1581705 RepID=UPI0020BFA186|nr:response regulator transcription factor [Micromonospora sp. NBRC 107566]